VYRGTFWRDNKPKEREIKLEEIALLFILVIFRVSGKRDMAMDIRTI
jgi:hypothetical protein